jgi:hypothetical protein
MPVRALFLALVLGVVAMPSLGLAPVSAARPDLTLVGQTIYDILPDQGRVAVTVRLRATNHLRDSATRRFFFRTGFLTVLPGTSHFKVSGGLGKPSVSVAQRRDDYTNLRIDFGGNLGAGRSTTLTLTFDIVDPGGAPDRSVRVTPTLVSFNAWAFATPDTPGATVSVLAPAGYNVTVGRGPLDGPATTKAGDQEWTSGSLDKPLDFVADVVADRLGELVDTSHQVQMPNGAASVVLVRAWADDTAWRDRVTGLVDRALPVLEELIGVPWPIGSPLVIEESLARGTDGSAGLFDPTSPRIEVSYAASDAIVLHELAHAWFNGGLVADRWAAEAFASYYAGLAAAQLGMTPEPLDPVDPSAAVAIPLNAWGDAAEPETDAYAYAASAQLARSIADRVGAVNLTLAWGRIAQGIAAYPANQAVDPLEDAGPEDGAPPPDWRALLDTLEEVGGQPLDDLWRAWVTRPEDEAALDARAPARLAYQDAVEQAGSWRLPPIVREAMRAWRFDVARQLMNDADAVLAQRDALQASASAAGVTLPDTLRTTFEGTEGLAAAAAEAELEQGTVDAIAAAEAGRPTTGDLGEQAMIFIGLIAVDPEGRLALARTSLAVGDIETAYVAALAAEAAWVDAADLGRTRLVSAVLLTLAGLLLLSLFRQRRRRVLADASAKAAAPGSAATPASSGYSASSAAHASPAAAASEPPSAPTNSRPT